MPEINPLSNEQIFLKKIAENTGSDYNTGDVSEINPLTIDQILLKEIAANTAGQSGDITELEGKVADNTSAIEAIVNNEKQNNLNLEVPNRVNLINSETFTNGYFDNTGAFVSNQYWYATDYIKVLPNTKYVVSGFSSGGGYHVLYNANKEVIGVLSDSNTVIEATSNTVYVRLSIQRSNMTNPQMEIGTTATAYTPYIHSVESRIEAVEDAVNRGSVSVISDGVKTYKELLNQLFLSIDRSKLSIYTVLQVGNFYYNLFLNNYMGVFYTASDFSGVGAVVLYRYILHNNDSAFAMNENGIYSDLSATAPASGTVFTVYY